MIDKTNVEVAYPQVAFPYNCQRMKVPLPLLLAACLLVCSTNFLAGQRAAPARHDVGRAETSAHVTVTRITYHGWPGSFRLSNRQVEVIVVPAIGRVMQFHFVGEDPVFWENRSLDGQAPNPASKEWGNFGGDKTWPAPQADWQKMTGREWPPPPAFDSMPLQAKAVGESVELQYPVDPYFGVRAQRRIQLDPRRPVMTITTSYEKVQGAPVKIGIGVITQLRHPQRAFMILPAKSQFPQGYVKLDFGLPRDVKVEDGFVSLTGGTQSEIGSDAGTLIWMNEKYVVRIDSARVPGAEYGDQGSNAIIYTSPAGPQAYIELEPFGPLSTMKVGDKIERRVTYLLGHRTEKDPLIEAKKILERQ